MHDLPQLHSHIPKLQSCSSRAALSHSSHCRTIQTSMYVCFWPWRRCKPKEFFPRRASEGQGPPRARDDMSNARPEVLITPLCDIKAAPSVQSASEPAALLQALLFLSPKRREISGQAALLYLLNIKILSAQSFRDTSRGERDTSSCKQLPGCPPMCVSPFSQLQAPMGVAPVHSPGD